MGLTRGVYVVAFGEPARDCAQRCIASVRRYLPGVPVLLCGDRPLGLEDLFVEQPDGDIGARGAKLQAYELTPPEWDLVLYLDADTEVIHADIQLYFQLLEDGWDFVICRDPMREDVAQLPRAKYSPAELDDLESQLGTLHVLMLNGGVWAFARSADVQAFFQRWAAEWQKHGQRDQGALLRALYAAPVRTYVLGNEWNYFPAYNSQSIRAAAIMHYPGQARRWTGQVPGRLDSPEAWAQVDSIRMARPRSRRRVR